MPTLNWIGKEAVAKHHKEVPYRLTSSFRDFVLEQLANLDGLRCKRMFGGHGLYCDEQFFGIVCDGRLHFKTHPDTLPDYLSQHCAVFAPSKNRC